MRTDCLRVTFTVTSVFDHVTLSRCPRIVKLRGCCYCQVTASWIITQTQARHQPALVHCQVLLPVVRFLLTTVSVSLAVIASSFTSVFDSMHQCKHTLSGVAVFVTVQNM